MRAQIGRDVRVFAALAVLLAGLQGRMLLAQSSTSEIVGSVTDATGAVLPGVALTITHKASGQERLQTSDSRGNFLVTALPIGEYSVKASLANFKTQVREGIILQVGENAQVNLVMELGDVSQEVTVVESVPLLHTNNAEVSEVINNQRVTELPLNGRQFVDLTLLSDNVLRAPRGTRGSALAQTGPAVLVAGQRAGHNMYYLDGVSVTDQYFNHLVASPSVDAIQEFNIQKSIYPAEFGGKASATISAVTKSGGNAFHGALYEFVRNDAFDARNVFDPAQIPPYRQNQFGATLGGPIKKDKTLFFLSYDGLRVRQAQTQTFSVPSDSARMGILPVNPVPTASIDPIAVAFLEKVPHANRPGETQNLVATPILQNDNNQGVARLDHHLTENDSLFGRLYIANFDTFQPFGSSLLNETLVPGFGYFLTTHTKSVALGETHVFSPNLISEFRFGFLRVAGGQQSQNQGIDFAAQNNILGIAPAADQTGFPSISFSGAYSSMGDPANLFSRRDNSFDYLENVSWIKGPHSMKFGGYLFRLQFNPSESPNARGSFTFNNFSDFLLGHPSFAQAGIGPGGSEYGRATWGHFYAQDDWRASSSLTVNYGLRYEINGKITDTQNRLSNIEVNRFVVSSDDDGRINPLANGLLPLIPVPVVTSKDAGYQPSLQLQNYHHIAPRVGLAWSVSDKTVVRAGWGLFFNQAAYNIQTALTENLPFFFNKSVNTDPAAAVPLKTQNILAGAANGTIGGSSLDYPYRSEFANSWNLNVQRMLGNDWIAQVSYFGSHISGADNSTFRNVPEPGPGAVNARRPNPLLSGFKAIRWDGWSIYHSGTLRIEKRMSHGVTLNGNYTWSKAMDDASDVGSTFSETNIPQDVRNIRAEKALSSFDHRQRLVFSSTYQIPVGVGHAYNPRGAAGALLNGWTVTSLGSIQSAAPFTVILPTDNANIGAGPAQRPNLIGDPNKDAPQTAQQWFNTAAFQQPAQFTFGDAGRNVTRADNEVNMDFSLIKNTTIRERTQLEFRAEMFNLFNHVNYADAPGRTAFTSTFGRYTSALNPRQIQFALKLLF